MKMSLKLPTRVLIYNSFMLVIAKYDAGNDNSLSLLNISLNFYD